MIRILPTLCLVAIIMSIVLAAPVVSGQDTLSPLHANLRARYDADQAFETVAFVEQFWRVPGNTGFNESIFRVESILKDAGYVIESDAASDARLTYRIERRPMRRPTWESVRAALYLDSTEVPLMTTETNRNMPVMYSFSTPAGGVTGELIHVDPEMIAALPREFSFEGKIAIGDTSPFWMYRECIQKRGALGMLCYAMPGFNRPEEHPDVVNFSGMPHDPDRRPWGVMLSKAARDRLMVALERGDQDPPRVRIEMETKLYDSEELTIIAQVRGSVAPDQEFVYSAHVQEPGANDNASGVGCQAEMARVAASLMRDGIIDPARTITFLWGDEITSTRRYVTEKPAQVEGVRWGMSLDMVGEDTAKTGGTFLIEKMPDPSAVWPRGDEHFSEWGGRPISVDRLTPHFYNDFVLNRCLAEAAGNDWVVKTNPFEGGSDHVPFLRAGKPGLLLWHFTDVYYHTDGDRIEMVSRDTLKHVGISALMCGMTLASADENTALDLARETREAAIARLDREAKLSRAAIAESEDVEEQLLIVETWMTWYDEAMATIAEVPVEGAGETLRRAIEGAREQIRAHGLNRLNALRPRLDE